MVQDFSGLERGLSVERLAGYRLNPADTDREAAARYLWNVAIAESLHTCLHFTEVTLRNAIHQEMSVKFNNPLWFEDPAVVTQPTIDKIQEIRQDIAREARQDQRTVPVITAGDLVAKASFGFWVSFFYGAYTNPTSQLWSGHSLKRVFPHATNEQRKPRELRKVFERVRRLRNRVSHHEPVWNRPHLVTAHTEIHEVIRWMNPEMEVLASQLDRFQAVYSGSTVAFLASVDTAFPDKP